VPLIDWKKFEEAVFDAALAALTRLMDRNAASFYAAAFDEFYAEEDGPIAMPCLAANSAENLVGKEDARWSSPDWKWTQIKFVTPEVRKLHRGLEKAAVSQDEALWLQTHARFIDAFVNIAKRLSAELRKRHRVGKEFGVFVFTEDDEVEVLRRCMTPVKFKKLFPRLEMERGRVKERDRGPLDGKLRDLRQDIHGYQKEILKLGAQALPMLRDALHDQEQAWVAADTLAKIGIPDAKAIAVLKQRARQGDESAFHDAIALALLGQGDFLLKLADSAKTRAIAARGICSLYSIWVNWRQQPWHLDYRPLELLLAKPGCKSLVKELCSAPCEIKESSVDEALRGLQSKHVVIREHAVTVLGDRRLGAKSAVRVLPALADRLHDRVANVRRRAILALVYWKKAARPHAADIRKLFKDPDADVAFTAKHYVKELT
jgi:hypothetical protein